MSVTATAVNREFLDLVRTQEGMDKIAEESQDVLSTKVYEDSFCEKIIPSKPITVPECYVDQTYDVIYRQEWIDPDAVAFVMDMDAQPTGQFIQGERYIVPFFKIMTPRYWKTKQQIRVYPYPITDFIEKNGSAEIIKQKDGYFVDLCDAAVTASGNTVAGGSVLVPTREDFVNLFNLLDANELESKRILMRKADFNRLLQWNAVDLDVQAGKTATDGWTSASILGREVIVTVKDDIITPGYVYCFTDPNFIGKHYTLEELAFELEKRFQLIQFEVSYEMGMSFGNIYGVARLAIPQS